MSEQLGLGSPCFSRKGGILQRSLWTKVRLIGSSCLLSRSTFLIILLPVSFYLPLQFFFYRGSVFAAHSLLRSSAVRLWRRFFFFRSRSNLALSPFLPDMAPPSWAFDPSCMACLASGPCSRVAIYLVYYHKQAGFVPVPANRPLIKQSWRQWPARYRIPGTPSGAS